jgi:hypothetical protein
MAYTPITSTEIEVGKAIRQELFTKIKDSLEDHETRISNLSTGGGKIEVFNADVRIGSFGSTVTGVVYHEVLQDISLIECAIQIFQKGSISSGILSIDVKRNTTPNDVGMTSVFTSSPSIDFATATDYQRATGTFNATLQDVPKGTILRLDINSMPAGIGTFRIILIGEV